MGARDFKQVAIHYPEIGDEFRIEYQQSLAEKFKIEGIFFIF